MTKPKTCPECGKQFKRTANQPATAYGKQKFCSIACQKVDQERKRLQALALVIPATKPCAVCGVTITRDPAQRTQSWSRMLFCGAKCREVREQEQRKSYRAEAREYLADNAIAPRQWRQDSDWIPVGLLAPRAEPPDRIRAGVIHRMMQGATI